MAEKEVSDVLNDAPLGLFHLRAVIIAGTGFFTDAYDLFIIGAALVLIKQQWHPSTLQIGLVGSIALLAAFVGALVFGRLADLWGRKKIYGVEALIMAIGAILSAFSPNLWWLLAARFIMGIGIGGDYPVSAVLMSEYANVRDRGKLVALVFSMQALGLVAGPVVAMTLMASGLNSGMSWRLMLGLGALPALAVIYLRRRMPESPRYLAEVEGNSEGAVQQLAEIAGASAAWSTPSQERPSRPKVRELWTNPKMIRLVVGTAGSWFLFDYAYYGNSISLPMVLKGISPHATSIATMAWSLIIFALFAAPGYVASFLRIDQMGHRRLQVLGFSVMTAAFFFIGIWHNIGRHIAIFISVFGISYFFAEFGPNTTTFVISSEVFPTSLRTTGHGLAAGIAKLGAFTGVFVFPILSGLLGVSGTLLLTAIFSFVGGLVTLLLPEPSGRTLEDLSHEAVSSLVPAVPRRPLP